VTDGRHPVGPLNELLIADYGERMPGVRHPITFSATPAAYTLAPPAPDADRSWLQGLLKRGRARVIAHPGPLSARARQCYFFLLTVRS